MAEQSYWTPDEYERRTERARRGLYRQGLVLRKERGYYRFDIRKRDGTWPLERGLTIEEVEAYARLAPYVPRIIKANGSSQDWPEQLLPQHRGKLIRSALDPRVAASRGYRSVTTPEEAAALRRQDSRRLPSLAIPIIDVGGTLALWQMRPDGKEPKYDWPKGTSPVLNVHPWSTDAVQDASVRLWIAESTIKADALLSAGELAVVGLQGVWTWLKHGFGPLPDWEKIPVTSREVRIIFDTDIDTNPAVRRSGIRLREFLRARGAVAEVYRIPSSKRSYGVEQYLNDGGTVAQLEIADITGNGAYEAIELIFTRDYPEVAQRIGRAMVAEAKRNKALWFYAARSSLSTAATASPDQVRNWVRAFQNDGLLEPYGKLRQPGRTPGHRWINGFTWSEKGIDEKLGMPPRVCGCGCGKGLGRRRRDATYATENCRKRAFEKALKQVVEQARGDG
jgi:hypothetical protein